MAPSRPERAAKPEKAPPRSFSSRLAIRVDPSASKSPTMAADWFAKRSSLRPGGGVLVLENGSLRPVLGLHSRFGVTPASKDPAMGILIVAECERKSFCLLVDELIGKQEVVIKNLGESFKEVTGIAGGCILGDGRVGLLLDVEALFGNPAGA